MNHLKEIQELKLEELKQALNKKELQNYYLTHTYKETAQYYKDSYGCSIKNFKLLLDYFNIERKGRGYTLVHEREKLKHGMISKYGADNAQKVAQIKEKTKQTNLKRYGVDNVAKSGEIQDKIKQTNLDRYGVENVYQAEEIKDKIKQTCLDKYGVEYASQAEQTKANSRRTKAERYGNPGYHNYEKMKQTNLARYGQELPQNPTKAKQTCLRKYGVDNVAKMRETHIKAAKTRATAVAVDGTKFDSGWEVLVYEYAKNRGYTIETQVPIKYKDNKVTFIDFKINNQLYEVKGTHLLNNCWESKGIKIQDKLQCYKDSNVIIITDVAKLSNNIEYLKYVDINNLNF